MYNEPPHDQRGMTRVAALLASLTLLAACATDTSPGLETDDAVPTIVLSAEQIANAPRLDVVQDMRIGTADGPEAYQLFRVYDVDVTGNGDLFVLDRGHLEVRVFDAMGAYVRTIGRGGEGPGEFRSPSDIAISNDTVLVFTSFGTHLYTRDGVLLETRPFLMQLNRAPPSLLGLAGSSVGWMTHFRDRRTRPVPRPGPGRDTTTIRRFDPVTRPRVGLIMDHAADRASWDNISTGLDLRSPGWFR